MNQLTTTNKVTRREIDNLTREAFAIQIKDYLLNKHAIPPILHGALDVKINNSTSMLNITIEFCKTYYCSTYPYSLLLESPDIPKTVKEFVDTSFTEILKRLNKYEDPVDVR